jgi:hypothetical protein
MSKTWSKTAQRRASTLPNLLTDIMKREDLRRGLTGKSLGCGEQRTLYFYMVHL